MPELPYASGNAGPNGAERDGEDFGDLFIRIILQIKQAECRPVWFLDLPEAFEDLGGVKRARRFHRDGEEIFMGIAQLDLWKTLRLSADAQESPVQGRKQPRLQLAALPQLVALGRPDIECLLSEIACVGLRAGQA